MATALAFSFDLKGTGSYTNPLDLSTPVDRLTIGTGAFDAINPAFTNGTSTDQADLWFHDERTLANGGSDSLDLAGGLTNPITGASLTFVKIKSLLIAIDAPDGTKALTVGPQNVANAWQGPWGGTGATVYNTVKNVLWLCDENAGLGTVTAATGDILSIQNNSGVSVTYRIFLIGTSA